MLSWHDNEGQNRITDDFPNRAGDLRKMFPIDFLDASLMASVKALALVVEIHSYSEF